MGVLLGLLMMCCLCVVYVSSARDIFFSRKPYGVKMCRELDTKFAGKLHVRYQEDKLECIIEEVPSKSRQLRKTVVLMTHGKQNVTVPVGVRQGSKGISKHKPGRRRAGTKQVKLSSKSNRLESYKVLSIAGSIAYERVLYILLRDIHSLENSCYIEVFKFFNESSWSRVDVPPLRVKCFVFKKRIYQMFKGRSEDDVLGLVTSGDVFQLTFFPDPFKPKGKTLSVPPSCIKWNGPTFCFYCGGIVCLQKDTMLKLNIAKDPSSAKRKRLHHKFSDMTDVAYSGVDNSLIIVCREQLILAKFSPSEEKIIVKDTKQTQMLTATWLRSSLVFHMHGRFGKFKTCVYFNKSKLD